MFGFVYWLKVLAVIFITNSHYHHVWPVASLAFGGQLGNNLYFLLSGFCLFPVKDPFGRWYVKRAIRIYPAVWLTNLIYLWFHYFYVTDAASAVRVFLYPTGFHFVGSIMLLYALFYGFRLMQKKWKLRTELFMAAVLVIFLTAYLLLFDKSVYHIDSVAEKWVLFMFTESMLTGALLREKMDRIDGTLRAYHWVVLASLLAGYFVGKKVFSGFPEAAPFQLLQPMIVAALTGWTGFLAVKLEKNGFFHRIPAPATRLAKWIAAMTLEIYLAQDLIISHSTELTFPVSFVVVTAAILAYGWIIHNCAEWIGKTCGRMLQSSGSER